MAHPTRLDASGQMRALSRFGPSASVDVASGAKALQNCVEDAPDPLAAAARASAVAMELCPHAVPVDAEIFALWVVDLALAARLNWARPVPLLAVAILHPSRRRGPGGRQSLSPMASPSLRPMRSPSIWRGGHKSLGRDIDVEVEGALDEALGLDATEEERAKEAEEEDRAFDAMETEA